MSAGHLLQLLLPLFIIPPAPAADFDPTAFDEAHCSLYSTIVCQACLTLSDCHLLKLLVSSRPCFQDGPGDIAPSSRDTESRVAVFEPRLALAATRDYDPDALIVQPESGDVSENEQWLIDNIE